MRIPKFLLTAIILFNGSQSLFAQSWQTYLGSFYTNSPVAANASNGFTQLWHDNAVIWKYGNSSVGGALRFGSANNLGASGFTERMRITDNGNVGIGTTAPQATLHVSTADAVGFLVENTTDNYASLNLKGNGKTWQFSKRPGGESDKFSLYYNNGTGWASPYLTATTDGNIGIGTASPQAKLAVNGDIFSKKVKVTQTGWPDYVFQRSYQLPTLSEVEQFIQLHHHLPEVPSAEDVKKNGLDVGENQATLLKKIEELTLYVIKQEKQIDKLANENKELKLLQKEVKELKVFIKQAIK